MNVILDSTVTLHELAQALKFSGITVTFSPEWNVAVIKQPPQVLPELPDNVCMFHRKQGG